MLCIACMLWGMCFVSVASQLDGIAVVMQLQDTGFKAELTKIIDIKMWDEAQEQAKTQLKEARHKRESMHCEIKAKQKQLIGFDKKVCCHIADHDSLVFTPVLCCTSCIQISFVGLAEEYNSIMYVSMY